MFNLSGKVALVTGAGQGVGAGIARALAGRGAAVVVNDLVVERAAAVAAKLADYGANSLALPFDVTDPSAVSRAVDEASARLGPVDILVNNAGVPEGMGVQNFREMDPVEWNRFVNLNLYGVLHCAHAVIELVSARHVGQITHSRSLLHSRGRPVRSLDGHRVLGDAFMPADLEAVVS